MPEHDDFDNREIQISAAFPVSVRTIADAETEGCVADSPPRNGDKVILQLLMNHVAEEDSGKRVAKKVVNTPKKNKGWARKVVVANPTPANVTRCLRFKQSSKQLVGYAEVADLLSAELASAPTSTDYTAVHPMRTTAMGKAMKGNGIEGTLEGGHGHEREEHRMQAPVPSGGPGSKECLSGFAGRLGLRRWCLSCVGSTRPPGTMLI